MLIISHILCKINLFSYLHKLISKQGPFSAPYLGIVLYHNSSIISNFYMSSLCNSCKISSLTISLKTIEIFVLLISILKISKLFLLAISKILLIISSLELIPKPITDTLETSFFTILFIVSFFFFTDQIFSDGTEKYIP